MITKMAKKNYRGPKNDMRKRNVEYLEERVRIWKMPIATLRAYQVVAHMTGPFWIKFYRIVTGDYPFASLDSNKQPVPLTTHSQFTSLMSLQVSDRMRILDRVIGDVGVENVRIECKVVIAFDRIREEAVQVMDVLGARDDRNHGPAKRYKEWKEYMVAFPTATDDGFLQGWVSAFTHLLKSKPVPTAFHETLKNRVT